MSTGTRDVRTICDTTTEGLQPRVSVAVSTYNRDKFLPRLFERLEHQSIPAADFELVLVDNGSRDATANRIRALAESSRLQVKAVRIENNRGPAGGRNVAWRLARAPIVAFTDDDCTPREDWLAKGIDSLAPNAILVGRTMPDPTLPTGPFSRSIQREDEKWMPTCNVFYWRSDVEGVGGFDETFVGVGCEDTDLGLRVCASFGRSVVFGTDVFVYHDVRPSHFLDALHETQRWVVAPMLFRRHPQAREWLYRRHYWLPTHPKVLYALVGLALAPVVPLAIVLVVPWLRFRTKTWRAPGRLRQVYPALPGTFLLDVAETFALVRGSIRYRTLVI